VIFSSLELSLSAAMAGGACSSASQQHGSSSSSSSSSSNSVFSAGRDAQKEEWDLWGASDAESFLLLKEQQEVLEKTRVSGAFRAIIFCSGVCPSPRHSLRVWMF